ncbi:helix-turn-helix domain-containing protein [Parapedobacter deserti]
MAQQDILAKIKRYRRDRGLSQANMAEALHVALKTYQNLEVGITRVDIDRLGQIADVLGVTLHDLLDGRGNANEGSARLMNEEKVLYDKIIMNKEAYIAQLEDSIRFYRQILREETGLSDEKVSSGRT